MPNVAFLPPRGGAADTAPGPHAFDFEQEFSPGSAPEPGFAPGAGRAPGLSAAGAFWSHGLSMGTSVILNMVDNVDVMSGRIAALPPRPDGARPMVAQYLFMVKTLSAAWTGHSRPALVSAVAALMHYADTFCADDAPQLAAALAQVAGGQAHGAAAGARLADGLIRRLTAPLEAITAIHHDFGSYLAQMAAASSDLETDTMLVTQRMQAEQVHAFILAQQINTLQTKLAEVRARRQGNWMLGDHADLVHRELANHGAALDSVRIELDQIRTGQAATMAEAAYLQGLLPTLSAYLSAIDRMGVGIHATLAGSRGLQVALSELKRALGEGRIDGGAALSDLQAALPNWRALAERLRHLPPVPPV